MNKFDCPCCNTKETIEEDTVGMFARCAVCGWEDDGVQQRYPDDLGANEKWTLNEARKAWKAGKTIFHEYPNPNAKKL